VGRDPPPVLRKRLSIREIGRRTGAIVTIRKALPLRAAAEVLAPVRASKLDLLKEEIHRLLGAEPRRPGSRIRKLIAGLGDGGNKTILERLPARGAAAVPSTAAHHPAHVIPAGSALSA
jgi:hypothetical protein